MRVCNNEFYTLYGLFCNKIHHFLQFLETIFIFNPRQTLKKFLTSWIENEDVGLQKCSSKIEASDVLCCKWILTIGKCYLLKRAEV